MRFRTWTKRRPVHVYLDQNCTFEGLRPKSAHRHEKWRFIFRPFSRWRIGARQRRTWPLQPSRNGLRLDRRVIIHMARALRTRSPRSRLIGWRHHQRAWDVRAACCVGSVGGEVDRLAAGYSAATTAIPLRWPRSLCLFRLIRISRFPAFWQFLQPLFPMIRAENRGSGDDSSPFFVRFRADLERFSRLWCVPRKNRRAFFAAAFRAFSQRKRRF